MESFCQYKDIFGKPNEGIRRTYRLFDISLVDTIPAILLGVIFARLLNVHWIVGVLISFVLGIIFHKLFCVNTTINRRLKSLLSP
jgi:hypothetical protein